MQKRDLVVSGAPSAWCAQRLSSFHLRRLHLRGVPKKIGRGYPRNLDAGPFQPMIDSWDFHLRAERKSAKTIRTYLEAAQWFAAEYLIPAGLTGWDGVRAKQVHEWTITLLGRYSDCYASNQFRALQQFFKWHATEDPDEPRLNPWLA